MAVQNQTSGWVGWIYFASMMMLVLGGLQALSGLVALFKDDFYLVTQRSLVVFNFTAWGWINLILGVFIIIVGIEIGRGSTWGRVVASFLVALNAVANLAFLPAYPIWSVIALIIDLFII
jgi:hypothetical protein